MAFLWLSFWTNGSFKFVLCTQITKKRASHKPTYENLQKSLEAMKSHCLKNGVTDLSIPRQGNPGPRMNTCNRVVTFAVSPGDK